MINLQKLFALSKSIHRKLVLLMIPIGSIQAFTGVILKYELFFRKTFFLDTVVVRSLHSSLSVYFTMILTGMMLTGSYVYIYPWFARQRLKKKEVNHV